jgi:hypothetical protein
MSSTTYKSVFCLPRAGLAMKESVLRLPGEIGRARPQSDGYFRTKGIAISVRGKGRGIDAIYVRPPFGFKEEALEARLQGYAQASGLDYFSRDIGEREEIDGETDSTPARRGKFKIVEDFMLPEEGDPYIAFAAIYPGERIDKNEVVRYVSNLFGI